MKLVELIVDDFAELLGFTANSLVSQPAHELPFYAFKEHDVEDLIVTELIKLELSKELNLNEEEDIYELTIGDYQTRHYDMCPGASALYSKIESGEIDVDMGLAIRAAKLQDVLFYLEKHTIKDMGKATFEDVVSAQNLAYEIMQLAKMMGLEEEHQYVYGHLQAIRDLATESMEVVVDSLPDYSDEISGSIVSESFESYNDYPQAASDNAKRAVKYAEENGWGSCGTDVGKQRAHQLAKREPISEETIARMSSFRRHQQNADTPYGEGCGKLMWDSWGGEEGVAWAERKLEQIKREKEMSSFQFASQDQQIVVGPLLVPNKKILRVDEEGNPYDVFFSEETVRTIGTGMMRDKLLDQLNLEHDPNQPIEGFMMSSWFVEDPKMDTALAYGFKDLVKGSWYGMYKILDPLVWKKVKNKEVTGFSIEAYLSERLTAN